MPPYEGLVFLIVMDYNLVTIFLTAFLSLTYFIAVYRESDDYLSPLFSSLLSQNEILLESNRKSGRDKYFYKYSQRGSCNVSQSSFSIMIYKYFILFLIILILPQIFFFFNKIRSLYFQHFQSGIVIIFFPPILNQEVTLQLKKSPSQQYEK